MDSSSKDAKRQTRRWRYAAASLILAPYGIHAQQAQDADELAKALSNPVAALISVPMQYNYEETFGDQGYRHQLNIQPVAPFSISEEWNLISRTILPVIYQNDVIPGTDQAGIGDTTQSVFFSPKKPTSSGLIWVLDRCSSFPLALMT